MVAYTNPQQKGDRRKQRAKRRERSDQVYDLGFERWQVVGLRKARGRQDIP